MQDLTAQVGQVVAPGAPVLSLVNNGGLKIETYVSEADVAKIKVARHGECDAWMRSAPRTAFPATVTTMDSAETQVNGVPSYLVTFHFTKAEPQVQDGMTGNVHIVLAEDDNVISVPSGLVLHERQSIFRARENRYRNRAKTGTDRSRGGERHDGDRVGRERRRYARKFLTYLIYG